LEDGLEKEETAGGMNIYYCTGRVKTASPAEEIVHETTLSP